jgi:hypothetical protein
MEYIQRRLNLNDETSGRPNQPIAATSGEELHALLFQPIAGDSFQARPETRGNGLQPLLSLKQLRFGLLDVQTMTDLSVACINSASSNQNPGCLNDLRMGASAGGKACQTCGHHHHNCPGHFGRIQLPHPVINPLFVGLLTSVMQTVCINCQRLRISPHYIQALFPNKGRHLHRLKSIGAMCLRQVHCQFCHAPVLHFKQQGICIMARPASGDWPLTMVPAATIFSTLVRLPDVDIAALGFNAQKNHPCNTIMSLVLVLPPVSRPAMRTVNLKTGNPFVVEAPSPPCILSQGGLGHRYNHYRIPGDHSGLSCAANVQ